MSWLFYKRGTIHPYSADFLFQVVKKYHPHPLGIKHPKTFYINEGDKLYWAWEEEDLKKMWRQLLSLFNSPRRLVVYFKKLDQDIAKALKYSAQVKRLDLKKIDNRGLLEIFSHLEKAVAAAHLAMNSEIDVIDLYFDDYLRSKIKRELVGLPEEKFAEIYRALSKPLFSTYVNKQEIMILKAALARDFSVNAAKNIYNNFWWTNLGWENMRPQTLEFFGRLIKQKSKNKKTRQELKQILDDSRFNRRAREQYLKKYKLGAKTRYWLEVYDKYVIYHDKRKELQVKTMYSFYLLLLETARRFKLKPDNLVWLLHGEVEDILRGKKADQREIDRRKKGIAAIVYFKNFQIWSGQAAIRLRQKYVKENSEKVKELRGLGVMGGHVKGHVKVCAGAKEALTKVKKGDILVCPMTLPDYVPAMKKAKAIITEEGGITCHAAIIARELKIPCVVGTRIATQVLKDGDLVEVDADKGIIKIIKK